MAETTIILGDWNSDVPAAPAGRENIIFAVDRTGAIPKFSASVKIDEAQTLEIDTGHVALDASLGSYYILDTEGSDFTLDNASNPTSGKCILIRIYGAGAVTLDSKYNARGVTLSRSSGRDMLGLIYDESADMWDCFWNKDA